MRNFVGKQTAVLPTRFSCVSNNCQWTYPKINLLQIQFFFRHKISKNPKFNHTKFHIVSSLYTKLTTTLKSEVEKFESWEVDSWEFQKLNNYRFLVSCFAINYSTSQLLNFWTSQLPNFSTSDFNAFFPLLLGRLYLYLYYCLLLAVAGLVL